MKLKRLEEAADSAVKTAQKAAAGLAQAEKGYKAATTRVSAAEAALRRARRELKKARKAAKSAQKDARRASKRLSKARKKAKRKAQEAASPSGARKTMVAKKPSPQARSPRATATRVDRSAELPEIEESPAVPPTLAAGTAT